jgi:hypothetical protein
LKDRVPANHVAKKPNIDGINSIRKFLFGKAFNQKLSSDITFMANKSVLKPHKERPEVTPGPSVPIGFYEL